MNKATLNALREGYKVCLESSAYTPYTGEEDRKAKRAQWICANYNTMKSVAAEMGDFHYAGVDVNDENGLAFVLCLVQNTGNGNPKEMHAFMYPVFNGHAITLVVNITDNPSYHTVLGSKVRSLNFDASKAGIDGSLGEDDWHQILAKVVDSSQSDPSELEDLAKFFSGIGCDPRLEGDTLFISDWDKKASIKFANGKFTVIVQGYGPRTFTDSTDLVDYLVNDMDFSNSG